MHAVRHRTFEGFSAFGDDKGIMYGSEQDVVDQQPQTHQYQQQGQHIPIEDEVLIDIPVNRRLFSV